ncbi:MAG: acyloxyacyl hydrolase [Alphaproteobacteria bacterium]|nr:acyloxyacyl hydrolase [Alphaproteobacteria bacterium]
MQRHKTGRQSMRGRRPRRRPGRGWTGLYLAIGLAVLPRIAAAQNVTNSEIKLGVLAHDVHFLGGKEGGADINPEVILQSPISDAMVAGIPGYLRWALQPRLHGGVEANTSGYTDQYYFGLTWTWQLASNLLKPDDGIIFGYSFGPGFNDGEIRATQPDRKSLGGHVLFRESFELGYQITPIYQVSSYIDHISNGGFDRYNQSINDIGVRFGVRF